jgi:hypothetical protein
MRKMLVEGIPADLKMCPFQTEFNDPVRSAAVKIWAGYKKSMLTYKDQSPMVSTYKN